MGVAVSLSRLQRSRPYLRFFVSVLELGAGTGLPSLRLLQDQTISLRQCVVTDYPSDEILQPLRDNFSRLQLIENVEVAGLDWNDIEQIGHIKSFSGSENKETGFDLILAADLLWYTDAHAALSNVICRLLRNPQSCERKKTTPRALLATGKYVKRANLYSFLEMIVKNGLSWRELSVDSPEDAGEWQSKNREWPSVPWKSDTPVWWQDEDGQREYLSVDNLSERKNTVWIFEIRWPQRLASS